MIMHYSLNPVNALKIKRSMKMDIILGRNFPQSNTTKGKSSYLAMGKRGRKRGGGGGGGGRNQDLES